MDEIFIECVRQYPCLWDTKLPSYKQLDVKDAAWKDILKKTNIENVTLAKTKWKHLRDTHREKLKKITKTKSGQSQKNIKTWKYMSHMEFLLPYVTNTERDTNVTPPPSDFSSSLEETNSAEVNRDSDSTPVPKKKKDDIILDDEDALLKLLKDLDDNREKRTAQRDELRKEVLTSGDPLKAFFDSMYQSTKQMPEFYQRSIKRKLFQSVMEAEDNIANTNYSYSEFYSNVYNDNSRPSTNQTNYSSGDASAYTPERRENTTRNPRDKETQDSMPSIEITPSGSGINDN